MPIAGFYLETYRLHILRGRSSRPLINSNGLDSIIKVFTDEHHDIGAYVDVFNDVIVEFTPMFKGTQHSDGRYVGSNVTFDMTTGTVVVDTIAPTVKLRNFFVHIKLIYSGESDSATFENYVHYEIHDSIVNAWLSPNVFEIPKNIKNQRFNVYVEFDDGIVANFYKDPRIVWSSGTDDSNVHPLGSINLENKNVGDEVLITGTLPIEFESKQAMGTAVAAAPWDDTNPQTVDFVSTGDSKNYEKTKRDKVVNVLFLPEGYQTQDESKFHSQVDNLVERLSKSNITMPLNILSKSMNFWKLFIPSRDPKISMISDAYVIHENLTKKYVVPLPNAKPVPFPEEVGDIHNWEIGELLFFGGYPILEFKNVSNANLRDRWSGLMRLNEDDTINESWIGEIPLSLIGKWKGLADRRLVEDSSTPFGIKFGKRQWKLTDVQLKRYSVSLDKNRRFERGHLDLLFANLIDKSGESLANLWVENGDNYDYIVFLTKHSGAREANSKGYMVVPGNKDILRPYVESPSSLTGVAGPHRALKMKDSPIQDRIKLSGRSTFIHELSHSFGLGDEYGERIESTSSTFFNISYPQVWVDQFANLQLESVLRPNDDSDNNLDGSFKGDLIKWRWHRIEKCAVLKSQVEDNSNNQIKVFTLGSQSEQFEVDDEVFLRERQINESLKANPKRSQLLRVVEVAADHLICELSLPELDDFPELLTFETDNIIYKPKRAIGNAYDPINFPFAEMITKNVRDFITNNNRPLTAQACAINTDSRTPPKALPELPGGNLCFKNKAQIVGLYAGGYTHHCGIFHPAGTCLMRHSHGKYRISEYCAVCRYILTEWIDPSKHPEVDAYYTIYPEL